MHKKLADLLEKKGIKELNELTTEEKADFDKWQAILSEGEVTVEKIALFCKNQIKLIETRWKSFDTDSAKKAEFIPYHTVYSVLLEMITATRAERANLEKYLDSLLQS